MITMAGLYSSDNPRGLWLARDSIELSTPDAARPSAEAGGKFCSCRRIVKFCAFVLSVIAASCAVVIAVFAVLHAV